MGGKSEIEWTDATWNPVTGCSHVSAGCEHCYAEALSQRRGWSVKPWTKPNAKENVILHPDRLDQPLHWRIPRRIFVNSMSDLFHEEVPDEFIIEAFRRMTSPGGKHHVYQVLTKRPERMLAFYKRYGVAHVYGSTFEGDPPGNVWLGVSIEEDRWCPRADIPRQVPAVVRFVSAEPLLGPLPSLQLDNLHWLIVGGESGPEHRPIDVAWVRDLRDRCLVAGVAFFHKQWGGRTPKAGGRVLDGRFWDEMPTKSGLPSQDPQP